MNSSKGGDGRSGPHAQGADAANPQRNYLRTILVVLFGLGVTLAIALWLLREPAADSGASPAAASALQAVRTGDAGARAKAVRTLTQTGLADSPSSIPAVIEALGDSDEFVRTQAAESLGTLGSYAVWARMSASVPEGEDRGTIDAAVKALLGSLANDARPVVRAAAAGGLGNIAATSPVLPTSRRGTKKGGDGSPTKKVLAISSTVDYKTIVDALIKALGDQDDSVRAAAATALGAAGPRVSPEPQQQLVAALKDPFATTRAAAANALPRFERGLDPVIPVLIKLAADDRSVHDACAQALHQIRRSAISAAAIPALIEGLRNPDRQVRIDAITLLAGFGAQAKDAVPPLIAVLDEPLTSDGTTAGGRGGAFSTIYTGPAHEAAKALGKIVPGSPSADKAIVALSRVVRGEARQRRSSAADALGKFGAAAAPAIPDLVKMLEESGDGKNPAASVDAEAAADALAEIAGGAPTSNAVVNALRDSLHSSSKASRSAILAALEQLGPKAATAAKEIEPLKNDPDPRIREAASKALEALAKH